MTRRKPVSDDPRVERDRAYNREWARQRYVPRPRPGPMQRLMRRVQKSDGCWEWTGPLNVGGRYGGISVGGRTTPCHKLSWEAVNGPVPVGLELDHLCRNRRCVRPAHLEAVTHAENMRRSAPAQATRDRGYRCRIHSDEPLARVSGEWVCRVCRRAANVRYRRRLGGTTAEEGRRRAWAARSPERRAEISRKIWETRHRNAAA